MSEFSVTYYEAITITANVVNIAGIKYQCSQKRYKYSLKGIILFIRY